MRTKAKFKLVLKILKKIVPTLVFNLYVFVTAHESVYDLCDPYFMWYKLVKKISWLGNKIKSNEIARDSFKSSLKNF